MEFVSPKVCNGYGQSNDSKAFLHKMGDSYSIFAPSTGAGFEVKFVHFWKWQLLSHVNTQVEFILIVFFRYIDALVYGLKSRKAATRKDKAQQMKYYTYMINEDADSTLLRLVEN